MKKLSKNNISLILLNVVILILELIGFYYSINEIGNKLFIYYTELSNLLLLISSIIYIYYLLFNKKINRWFNILKEISIISIMITFLVVIFILIPFQNFDFLGLLLNGSMLYHHLLCPILAIIMFLFFDKESINDKDYIYANSLTILYAIVFILLNVFKVLEGPYFFLLLYSNPLYKSILWLILIPFGSFKLAKIILNYKNNILTNK